MVRFHEYLGFQLDFQLGLVMLALKIEILGQRCKVLSSKELWYGVPTLIEVQEDPSVSVCMLGLTRIGVVVVEMHGEISPLGRIWWRSQWRQWYGVAESCSIVL